MMRRAEVFEFVKTALECSLYIAPTDPGLTDEELFEAGKRLGYQRGEIGDSIDGAAAEAYFGDTRLMPRKNAMWGQFHFREDPDYRNVKAFDFVCTQLRDLARSQGTASARLQRTVVVERSVGANLPRLDVEVAIAVLLFSDHLVEENGSLRLAPGRENYPLPSEQLRQAGGTRVGDHVQRKELRALVYPVVQDLVGRRSDGRPPSAEPLDAFSGELEKLSYRPFRLWWVQTVAELRLLDPSSTPVAIAVLAAALVEGALTFVVKHARTHGLGVFASKDFDRDPRTWKIDDLVASAASGRDSAILDPSTRHRADELIKVRQRIHAGRMLADYPTGVPDLRPEEARDAKATAEAVIRRILDWLQKYPPKTDV